MVDLKNFKIKVVFQKKRKVSSTIFGKDLLMINFKDGTKLRTRDGISVVDCLTKDKECK